MKKTLILGLMLLVGAAGLKAQDCEYIVSFKYGAERVKLLTPAKLDYQCRFSRNNFFVTDQIPKGAEVHSISEVKEQVSGISLPSNYVVNLDSLSYFRYDFVRFQDHRGNKVVYFETRSSAYRYLALRPLGLVMEMTGEPNVSLDENYTPRETE